MQKLIIIRVSPTKGEGIRHTITCGLRHRIIRWEAPLRRETASR